MEIFFEAKDSAVQVFIDPAVAGSTHRYVALLAQFDGELTAKIVALFLNQQMQTALKEIREAAYSNGLHQGKLKHPKASFEGSGCWNPSIVGW